MKKYLIIPLLILLASCSAFRGHKDKDMAEILPQPEVALSQALEAIRLGREAEARTRLLDIREEYRGSTWAARAAFVLGMQRLREKEAEAVPYLTEALSLGAIRPYVLLHLARAYRSHGNLAMAEQTYKTAEEDYPDFTYRGDVLYERALVLKDMGRSKDAGAVFEGFIKEFPGNSRAAKALLEVARLKITQKKFDSAFLAIKTLYIRYPGKTPAVEAAKLLREHKELQDLSLTAAESCERGEALFKARLYTLAAAELQGLIKRDNLCDKKAEPLLVETLFRLKQYNEAEAILERSIRRSKRTHEHGYAYRRDLSLLATVYLRENKTKLLIKTIHDLTRNFHNTAEARRALLMEGTFYEDSEKFQEALGTYELLLKDETAIETKDGKARHLSREGLKAAWKRGWLLYRMGMYLEAYSDLNVPASTLGWKDNRKFAYWRGRALEKAGFDEQAQREYELACKSAVPGYYCYMAQKRLLSETEAIRPPILPEYEDRAEKSREGINERGQESPFKAAFMLISTGLTREAAVETKRALKKSAPQRKLVSQLMGAFYGAGDYYHAIWMYDSYFYLLYKGEKKISPELARIAFPIKVVDYMKTKGLTGEADPLLVAAVMREESSFNPETISRTGAVGLMQVMPSTARFIAEASKMGPLSAEDMLDMDTNIRLGSWYIAYLWQKTAGNPVETIAGYNAGLNMVKKWRKRYPLEDDEFIESIPYTETRNYTKKVLKSYAAFRAIASSRDALLAYNPQSKDRLKQ